MTNIKRTKDYPASAENKRGTNYNELSERNHTRGRPADGAPNPIDIHVGNRMRLRRTLLNMRQHQLAQKLGLTFQQVQKYEKGCNRIGASRLWDIAKILNVPMDYFFEDMEPEIQEQSPMMLCAPEGMDVMFREKPLDPMSRQETQILVRAYYKIRNRKIADALFQLLVLMSKSNATLPNERSPKEIYDYVNDAIENADMTASNDVSEAAEICDHIEEALDQSE